MIGPMNDTQSPKTELKHRSWLVRFQPSPSDQDWLVEVTPVGSQESYRFPHQAAWLAWCAEVFNQERLEKNNP